MKYKISWNCKYNLKPSLCLYTTFLTIPLTLIAGFCTVKSLFSGDLETAIFGGAMTAGGAACSAVNIYRSVEKVLDA